MLKKSSLFITLVALCFITIALQAQVTTNTAELSRASKGFRAAEDDNYAKALVMAKQKGWPLVITGRNNRIATLVGVDVFGFPKYYVQHNNTIAAATTRANQLWPGGSSGLNLSGSSANMKNKIAEWDGGSPLSTHVELTGRITIKDGASAVDHSTHVAGTMIATGVNPIAKGMAFGAQGLISYDYNNDISEMFGEANNIVLSNHSYGILAGWNYNSSQSRWEWYGKPGDPQDYKFGYYSVDAQSLDSIAYNAPYYLIVKAAGNSRDQNGPAVGTTYWGYNSSGTLVNQGARPATISSNDSYDIISWDANAKNILTVGAVNGLPAGYNSSSDVVMSSFSGWGPTDDGRIKPDLVADGVGVTSCVATSNTAYATYDGTSMATPNTTGSLFLLQEYYSQLKSGLFMRSATLKGLAIHTADEAGASPGPDYQFGWGLLNVLQASKVLTAAVGSNNAATSNHLLYENTLDNASNASFSIPVVASGNGPLVATICWTDVKGTVETANVLNNSTKKLVNDLDVRITKGSTTYMPWVLDPANPANAATRGDNVTDNVERVNVDTVQPGQTYTITVTHKGTLAKGTQAYSLIVSGVGGTAICSNSGGSTTAGAKITNVTLGSFTNSPSGNCATSNPKYNSYTNLVAAIQPSQSLPLSVTVNSCDATNNPKVVAVYIDYNNNGVFTDAGEQVAISGALVNGATYSTTITTPSTLAVGNTSVMRVIVEETSTPSGITPCGIYTTGETEDYLVKVSAPSNDLAFAGLVSPLSGICANPAQLVTVSVQNKGTVDKTNVTLQAVVKNGSSAVATLSAVYPGTITAGSVINYTFQTPISTTDGATYTIAASIASAGDQNGANDTSTSTVVIAAKPTAPAGTAAICNGTAILNVTSPNSSANYFWYDALAATSSIATGSSTTSTDIPSNNTYYVSSGTRGSVGLTSKNLFSGGDYQANGGNYMLYTAQVPVILESVRLFTKYPGTVTIIAADLSNITSTGYSYLPLSSQTINVYSTNPNPVAGASTATAADAADTGNVFYVNMLLPAGSHAIIVTASNATIFRNNTVTGTSYPYTLPNVISITGNSASSNSYYYYLYDMKVRTSDCLSDRTAVVATVPTAPVITQVGDSLVSNVAAGNQWYLNGTLISGANGQKYHPVQSGNYQTAINNGTCTIYSNTLNVTVTATVDVNGTAIGLTVAPNPSSGVFNVSFAVTTRDDLKIDVVNMIGQTVYSQTYPSFIGTFSNTLNIGNVAAGVYILKIQHHNTWYLKKLLVK